MRSSLKVFWLFLGFTLVAALLLGPYLFTTIGPSSLCFREARISDKQDKISGALLYIAIRKREGTYPKQNQMIPTGLVDKGGRETPYLSWASYVSNGESHYVHFNELDPIDTASEIRQIGQEALVVVDACGTGLYKGTHQ